MGEVWPNQAGLFSGEVAEWSIASDLKSDDAAMYPEVRILSSPLVALVKSFVGDSSAAVKGITRYSS